MKTKKRKTFILDGILKKRINGYIFVKVGRVWIPEHRLVCEEFIGRILTKEETVHHIDKNKENNKIENLMIFPNQREHSKFHVKIQQFGLTRPILRQIENRFVTLK